MVQTVTTTGIAQSKMTNIPFETGNADSNDE
jgi:hypothetical protein